MVFYVPLTSYMSSMEDAYDHMEFRGHELNLIVIYCYLVNK